MMLVNHLGKSFFFLFNTNPSKKFTVKNNGPFISFKIKKGKVQGCNLWCSPSKCMYGVHMEAVHN